MERILLVSFLLVQQRYTIEELTMNNQTQIQELYDQFLIKYPRDFNIDPIGYDKRLKVFQENVLLIEKSNYESSSAVYEITKFADWTENEFDAFSRPLIASKNRTFHHYDHDWIRIAHDGSPYPSTWDWRLEGVITAVKTQSICEYVSAYQCNSCYAYAVAAVVESLFAIKYNQFISISEHEMVDCDLTNFGCWSGSTKKSMLRGKYIGFTHMMDYPVMLETRSFCPLRGQFFIKNLYRIDPHADAIAWFVSHNGPAVLNFVFPKQYKFYKSGILSDAYECWIMTPNHAAAVVGYGMENGRKYWIIKNSWGDWWGEQGFFRIERGTNACQVENYPASASL
ncbi:unnamed protein product [Thelazia callipaeda]|uniref:Pept_C1 domain-containing protein n=1 Tax=Thelazia callipaeda TaxID=103827 RepID=A0A0N5CZK4_THECL|nr:unnamed protein product [Thelazia callipaeda]